MTSSSPLAKPRIGFLLLLSLGITLLLLWVVKPFIVALVMLTTLGGLVLFGAAGIVIGPLIGALSLTVWKLWGSATDEARGAERP